MGKRGTRRKLATSISLMVLSASRETRSSAPCRTAASLGPTAATEAQSLAPGGRGAGGIRPALDSLQSTFAHLEPYDHPGMDKNNGAHSPDKEAEAQRCDTGSKATRNSSPHSLPRALGFENEEQVLNSNQSCKHFLRPENGPVLFPGRPHYPSSLRAMLSLTQQESGV